MTIFYLTSMLKTRGDRLLLAVILLSAVSWLIRSSPLSAAPPFDSFVAAGIDDATFNGVAVDYADRVWAVGDRGAIWGTQNAGRIWTRQESGTTANLYGLAFTSPQVGVVVGGLVGSQSRLSHGVVLRTKNGGETWEPLPESGLPRLTGISLVGSRLIAWGDYSTQYKTAVFGSDDNGNSWQPLSIPIVHCNALAVSNAGQMMAIERVGNAFSSQLGVNESFYVTDPMRPLSALASVGQNWIAGGMNGQVLRTSDGRGWAPVRVPLSPEAQQTCNWHVIHQFAEHTWIAGAPGSVILHSGDYGKSWEVQSTEQTLPIRAMAFADANRGWAVGALGMILATRDGGKSWYSQRSTASRIGLLSVTASLNQVPWPVLVASAWDEKVSAASLSLYHSDLAQSADFLVESWNAKSSAAPQIGLVQHQSWQDSAPKSSSEVSALTNRLMVQILSLRPDVLLTSEMESATAHRTTSLLVSTAMQQAASGANASILQELKLSPWRVSKLCAITDTKHSQYAEIPARLLKGPGLSIVDLIVPIDASLENLSLRTLEHSQNATASSNSLWGGVAISNAVRRTVQLKNLGNYQLAMGRAARASSVDALIAQPREMPDLEWQTQLDFVIRALPTREIPSALLKVAEACANPPYWPRRRMALEKLIQQQPESDLASIARSKLLQLLISEEMLAWSRSQGSESMSAPTTSTKLAANVATPRTPFDASVVPAIATQNSSPVDAPSQDKAGDDNVIAASANSERVADLMYNRFLESLTAVHKTDPSLAKSPSTELLFQSATRAHAFNVGKTQFSTSSLEQVASLSSIAGWPQVAVQELSLATGQVNRSRWIAFAHRTEHPPMLDGVFDEPFWEKCPAMQLSSLDDPSATESRKASAANIRWSYDEHYLYIAIDCPRVMPSASTTTKRLRKYDSDLSQSEHVLLTLDTDRDYNTGIELAVSESGETFDRCGAISSYNPKWSVAVPKNNNPIRWQAEIAIRLMDLTPHEDTAGRAWAVAAYHRDKEGTRASWSQLRTSTPLLQSAGLLLFTP
jgi:photosystem II stability/assembly factor-like uncharacterized protein